MILTSSQKMSYSVVVFMVAIIASWIIYSSVISPPTEGPHAHYEAVAMVDSDIGTGFHVVNTDTGQRLRFKWRDLQALQEGEAVCRHIYTMDQSLWFDGQRESWTMGECHE